MFVRSGADPLRRNLHDDQLGSGQLRRLWQGLWGRFPLRARRVRGRLPERHRRLRRRLRHDEQQLGALWRL
jgi:hypothetical protein